MDKWYTHFSYKLPTLSDQERQFVEYITGRIPLLLRPLFKIKKFDEATFLRSPDLLKVNADVINFFMAQEKALKGCMRVEYVLSPPVRCLSSTFLQIFQHHGSMSSTISCRTGLKKLVRCAVLLCRRRSNWTLHLRRRLRIHDDSTWQISFDIC
jgi:hypothetical protein